MPMGRPTKFTNETKRTLLGSLSQGATQKDACAIAGISEETYYRWMNIGEACLNGTSYKAKPSGDKNIELRQDYSDFYESIQRAKATARVRAVQTINRAGLPHWTHKITGEVIYDPPLPVTYMHKRSGETIFDTPLHTDDYEFQWSGEVWIFESPQWTAHAWLLERSDPLSWGRRTYARIEGLDPLIKLAEKQGLDLTEIFEALIDELS